MGQKSFKVIKYLVQCFLEVIYPNNKCVICNEEAEDRICDRCKKSIKRVRDKYNEILSYGYYGGTLKKAILKFKYEKNFEAGRLLSKFLVQLICENNIKADYISFIPMTRKSLKKRGYNQCEVLAKIISNELDIPVLKCLVKVKETKEQKRVSKDERYKNIHNAFKIINDEKLNGKKIILIDDVATTGATLLECKKNIEKCNIKEIFLLTIAKSNI